MNKRNVQYTRNTHNKLNQRVSFPSQSQLTEAPTFNSYYGRDLPSHSFSSPSPSLLFPLLPLSASRDLGEYRKLPWRVRAEFGRQTVRGAF